MNIEQAEKALEKVAKKEGISIEAVRREIELAIAEARSNPAPEMQAFWKSVPCEGEYPTPEKVIIYFASRIENK